MNYQEYRTCEEKSYFASDLNKYIQENLPRTFSCMNIDCLLLKLHSPDGKIFRIIESKHSSEKTRKSENMQNRTLETLQLLDNNNNGIRVEVYKLIGDYPFNKAEIYSYKYKEWKTINNEEMNSFLQFDIDFSSLKTRDLNIVMEDNIC